MKNLVIWFIFMGIFSSCSTKRNFEISKNVDIDKFVKKWYVIAGRFTYFEQGAHNPVELYTWGKNKESIEIEFSFNSDSFTGERKIIEQKAWVYNKKTNAHWKVRPLWPLKLDYYIIAHADDYSWSAVGVHNQNYLWIMASDWKMSEADLDEIIKKVKARGYNVEDIIRAPQKW